jgi:hypothetical protein
LLDEFELVVTKRLFDKRLLELYEELELSDQAAILNQVQVKTLVDNMNVIRAALDAEVSGIYAWSPTPKRIDLDALLDNPSKLFMPNALDDIPEIALQDIISSAKCIAFELPTSAAFHILRATEAILKDYYCAVIKQKRVNLMWGNMIMDLRKRPKTKCYVVLHNHLDHIRSAFRNPTQHPEAIYDIHEIQDLWSLCVDAINRISKVKKEIITK